MPVKHPFQSQKADGTDETQVRPSNWNQEHLTPPFVVTLYSDTGGTSTNMPSALEELLGVPRHRVKMDLSSVTEVRITVSMGSGALSTAQLRVQYSIDNQTSWAYLDGSSGSVNGDGPGVMLSTPTNGGGIVSDWKLLTDPAKTDVWIRPVTLGGNGANDPVIGTVTLQLR